MADNGHPPKGLIPGIVRPFLSGTPAIIILVIALCLGAAAIFLTPREEDPQIVVPLADIYVQAPGAGPGEVEKLVATPLEQLLWQIDGVEYVYSISRRGMAIVTVRFYVGENQVESLVKLHDQITMHSDQVPPLVRGWTIKPVDIDDVPIVNLCLHSERYDDHELRRIGEEVLWRLSKLKNISRTHIVGGCQREIRVELLPGKMTGYNVSLMQVSRALQGADVASAAGNIDRHNQNFTVTTNSFLRSTREVLDLVVGVDNGRPVYLSNIAKITDGPAESTCYTRIGQSHRYREAHDLQDRPLTHQSVTLALAKKSGTNAVNVSRSIMAELGELKKSVIPDDVHIEVTRDYGYTAQEKVNSLLNSLFFAIATVVVLLAFALGRREALVVAVAVPISFSLALFCNYLLGYTINRVTLFALILSLGLVVDDPITNVDNIQRHIFMGKRNPFKATLFAVQEVLPPVLISTVAIIIAFAPLFFITGMMGPYMAPMSLNVPLTVIFSTLAALTVVPWMTYRLLRNHPAAGSQKTADPEEHITRGPPEWIFTFYRKLVTPFLESRIRRWLLLTAILVLLVVSMLLVVFRMVPLKMLPFDNKNEFQIVIDMPEGTTLESTDAVVRDFEKYLRGVPEVTHYTAYVGTHSPMDFNAMVRHYYLRQGSHQADIRVDLVLKGRREMQSHAIVLRLRKDLMKIAEKNNAAIQVVEVPPGPPVLATIVAELYGSPDKSYEELIAAAEPMKQLMREEPFVVDVDDMTESVHDRYDFVVDREKAALHGVSTREIIQTLQMAVSGTTPARVHDEDERQPLHVKMILPRQARSNLSDLTRIPMDTASGHMVPLAEIVEIRRIPNEQTIYHKNLDPVVYVTAEMAGRAPAEGIIDMQARLAENPLPEGIRAQWAGEGEWKITLRVFRDLGIAFAVALAGIYILMIIQTNSFLMPVLIMMAIPLTLIGIMPGFWLLNLVAGGEVGGYQDLVFFTATSMIGMIALGGIVIRNSVVLIDFIRDSLAEQMPVREAIVQSGAIRLRPIVLTAATTALGAWPITLDPIFSGLAWALIFGLIASTLFTLLVVPVAYYAVYGTKMEQDQAKAK
ncbi:multidrug efflux pump subunit AcrB [Desulfosalsimonas propionicica]|uniref:Multidrug efflux pump subunit AcrB n=1 Tax=Desulfosalsimonas propionicica TaxID=332175 RepID=A0A7W0HJJ7_9BACT|nr:efflux RND transporter permease subunit [Desulfosalsimonas propionicica]MBA2880247.1 multidrug efflux pump subunit AcrB [Desulfosalsimonas propionicica]